MNRGDVYWVSLDPTRGHEQSGKRPVLVLSEASFKLVSPAIVAPITRGGDHARRRGFIVPLAGCETTGVVLCNQIRALDIANRGGEYRETLPVEIVDDVLARVAAILGLE